MSTTDTDAYITISLRIPAGEPSKRRLADALWIGLAEHGHVDSVEGMEYRRVLLGQTDDQRLTRDEEGPEGIIEKAADAVRLIRDIVREANAYPEPA